MLPIITNARFPFHGDHHKIRPKTQAAAQPFKSLLIHALLIIGDTQNPAMPQASEVFAHLTPAVPIVQLEVADFPFVFKIAVIDDKGDMDAAAQLLLLMAAESQNYHSHHIPHRREWNRRH